MVRDIWYMVYDIAWHNFYSSVQNRYIPFLCVKIQLILPSFICAIASDLPDWKGLNPILRRRNINFGDLQSYWLAGPIYVLQFVGHQCRWLFSDFFADKNYHILLWFSKKNPPLFFSQDLYLIFFQFVGRLILKLNLIHFTICYQRIKIIRVYYAPCLEQLIMCKQ